MIKGRASKGNLVTKYTVKRIELKEKGLSTLKPRKLWFDDTVQRLNIDDRGEFLGEFTSEDRLLIINQKGVIKTVIPELTLRFEDDMIVLEKWEPEKPVSAIYWEGDKELFYIKRFLIDNPDRVESIITEHPKSYLEKVFTDYRPRAAVVFAKKRGQDRQENQEIDLEQFISVKGISAMGNQLTKDKVLEINAMEALPYERPIPKETNEIEVIDEENVVSQELSVTPTKTTKKPKDKPTSDPKKADSDDGDDEGQTTLF
jgi:topoisomerase-4 subunit A